MTRSKILCTLMIWPILILGIPALAAVPSEINFQGKLLNTASVPQNGSFSMIFKIYDSLTGGTQLWSETQSAVSVSNGVFSVQLGAFNPIPENVFAAQNAYLEVTVAGQTGAPREQLITSPYAFHASSADVSANALNAQYLVAGDTNYIQNSSAFSPNSVFYVSSGTVGGTFTATGTVTLGGTPGVNDVSVKSDLNPENNVSIGGNLSVSGAGPHTFNGNIEILGNGIEDSGGTSRITLGDPLLVNAGTNGIGVPAGQQGVMFSTSVFLNGTPGGDNYIAYPFTALTTITVGNAVSASAGGVTLPGGTNRDHAAIGFAVNSATLGQTVWVATTGIFCEAVAAATISVGNTVATDGNAGEIYYSTTNGAVLGKAISGASAGQTLCIVISSS